MREQTGRASRSIHGSEPGVKKQNLGGLIMGWLLPAGNRRGRPVSKEEKDLCTGVSKAH